MEKLQGLAQKKINIKTERTAEEISAIKERTKAALAAAMADGRLKAPERGAAKTNEVAALKEEIAALKAELVNTQRAVATGEGAELAAALVDKGELTVSELPVAVRSVVLGKG